MKSGPYSLNGPIAHWFLILNAFQSSIIIFCGESYICMCKTRRHSPNACAIFAARAWAISGLKLGNLVSAFPKFIGLDCTSSFVSMAFTLYHYPFSICSIMVRYTLALRGEAKDKESGIDVTERVVDITQGDQLSEDFLCNINGKGQVWAETARVQSISRLRNLYYDRFPSWRHPTELSPIASTSPSSSASATHSSYRTSIGQ